MQYAIIFHLSFTLRTQIGKIENLLTILYCSSQSYTALKIADTCHEILSLFIN